MTMPNAQARTEPPMEAPARPGAALVTGGTSGIGLATAIRLAARGHAVVINGRNPERGAAALARVRDACPGAEVRLVAADVSQPEGAQAALEAAAGLGDGRLAVLVNAAGGDFVPRLLKDTDLAQIDGVVRHWMLSTLYCCRLALPLMGTGGAIVNVASDAGKVPTPGEAVIGGAMAGIAMFSRTLAMEAKRNGIRVNVVTPSLVVDTQTHARVTADGFSARLFEKATAMAHLGLPEPDDVAALIAFLAGPEAARITAQVVSVNGGISAG
ncbi:SDR family oxidoreductase [Xanthobacter sp. V3C-3]|uniref:SDR family NAD(P)-dependent oxidoreductase n=1 Tax=Xanthobacter lutulentifluminis TaxID=3119935 RepID=UPI003728A9AB